MKALFYIPIFFALYCNAQNLIPNPSFEYYINCPTAAKFYEAAPWCGLSGGEEAYNKCFSDLYGGGGFGVPDNMTGFQYARTGYGFGSVSLKSVGSGTTNAERREYIHVPLISNLQSGKIYCGTMFVNLINTDKFTTDKIGMALTSNSYACNQAFPSPQTIAPLNIVPQVANPLGNFITDTLNWVEVSATFTATGTEAYLTIGNFYDDANTATTVFNPSAGYFVIYFLIDDVSIEEVFPVKAKNDTIIMQGDSVIVGDNTSEAAMYNWQPTAGLSCTNCPNPKASPTITTTYTVTKTQCKAVTTDEITVSVSPTGLFPLSFGEGQGLRFYPNPNNGNMYLRYNLNTDALISIYDISGRALYQHALNSNNNMLQIQADLSNGVYFYSVKDEVGKVLQNDKLIIMK